jgi:hypothetical protein
MRTLIHAALGLTLLTVPALADLNETVGPKDVPLGGKLSVSFSNDNPGKFGVTTSLWRILDANGAVVYIPTTSQTAILMGPGGVYSFTWNLKDQGGTLVAPGAYTLEYKVDTGAPVESFPFNVIAEGAGLVLQGTATTQPVFGGGPARSFYLTSPSDAGLPYFLLVSTDATTPIPTCAGEFPLGISPLFNLSLTPGAVIQGSFGVLNGNGESTAPKMAIPNNPAYVGTEFSAAFVVLNPANPCLIERISNRHDMKVL